ncbi:hypothetical protein QBC38DRAFT_204776 [Podospora fimiseda]|uniref:Zn(2)-C6 fungal-type domain-containing protein n=1 Tax=Podospora fimiseda TaxID=252190 RepID=A0AAN7BYB5_9PEZI|nr:hypothetical protein QBC38DRAFT_204776 [Podospora fimiseda]
MPANYSAEIGEEKAVPSLHSSPSSSDSCSPSWMTARVVTRWLCGGDTEPTYQPVPQTTSYEHVGSTSVVNAGASSIMPEEPIGSSQPISFACDRGLWGQGELLPNWTPMQPTRVTEVQPPATKEEMLYPDESPSTLASNQGHPVLHTHNYCTGYLPSPPLKSEPASASSSSDSSPFLSQGGFSFVSLSLNQGPLIDIYDVNDEQANQAALLAPTAPAPLRTHTRPPAAKRGPFKDNEQRLKTALTRKMGSCIRCRMQRIRCVLDDHDKDGPCLACRKLLENGTSIYRPSCARLKITDMKLFKPGQVRGFEWTQRWKGSIVDDIGTWESVEIRKIEVTEGYTGGSMKLEVRRFKPQEGDKLDRTWVSARGEKKKVAVPPYAIVNMDAAATDIKRYLRDYRQACFKALLGSQDNLIYKTYALALERAGHSNPFVTLAEKQLLVNTLDLWFSIRLSTKSFEIVGEDLLEMPKDIIDDRSSDQYGKVPIPPVLGAQLDSILIHQILAKYRRTVLEDLSKMVQEKKPSTWLTIYLATFILLHNAALITKHDAGYAKKHGMNRRFARPEEVKEYNVVLHYYHYCNKGIYPFTSECKDYELSSLAELDDHGIEMVHFTRKVAAEQKEHWESLWAEDKYEDESYYLSQLYEAGWKARLMG